MEQQTGSKLGKEYIKAEYCHPAYLTYMQSISWEIYRQVKKQQLELDMKQQPGSKSGKEYIKAMYGHPAY